MTNRNEFELRPISIENEKLQNEKDELYCRKKDLSMNWPVTKMGICMMAQVCDTKSVFDFIVTQKLQMFFEFVIDGKDDCTTKTTENI